MLKSTVLDCSVKLSFEKEVGEVGAVCTNNSCGGNFSTILVGFWFWKNIFKVFKILKVVLLVGHFYCLKSERFWLKFNLFEISDLVSKLGSVLKS